VAVYNIEVKKSAAKELDGLPARDCARVVAKIRGLASDPRPHGAEKLTADEKYRLRQGNYRILYEIDDRARRVTIVKIADRKEAYRS
jgi:mRNA interferase RelE/StbE